MVRRGSIEKKDPKNAPPRTVTKHWLIKTSTLTFGCVGIDLCDSARNPLILIFHSSVLCGAEFYVWWSYGAVPEGGVDLVRASSNG